MAKKRWDSNFLLHELQFSPLSNKVWHWIYGDFMDAQTNLDDLKGIIRSFCEERDWGQFHNPKDLSIGLILEASELLANFRYKSLEQMQSLFKNELTTREISHELADVFFFVLRFSQMFNIDLSEALKEKMAINAARYPVEASKGNNKKYTELQGR